MWNSLGQFFEVIEIFRLSSLWVRPGLQGCVQLQVTKGGDI